MGSIPPSQVNDPKPTDLFEKFQHLHWSQYSKGMGWYLKESGLAAQAPSSAFNASRIVRPIDFMREMWLAIDYG